MNKVQLYNLNRWNCKECNALIETLVKKRKKMNWWQKLKWEFSKNPKYLISYTLTGYLPGHEEHENIN